MCDLGLGVQWLYSIGLVTMDFTLIQIQIELDNKIVVLKGLDSPSELKLITTAWVSKYASHNPHSVMGFW